MTSLQDIYKNVVWNSHEFEGHLKTALANTRDAEDWEKLLDIVGKTEEFLQQARLDIQKRYPPSRPPSMQLSASGSRSTGSDHGSFSAHSGGSIAPPVPLSSGPNWTTYNGASRTTQQQDNRKKENEEKERNRGRASPGQKNQAKDRFMADTLDFKPDKHKNELDPQRIFLPNISTVTTDNNLRSAFAHYGKIREARIFKKPDGTPAGKGIIWFESTETVTQLLHKTFIVDGAEVKVAPFYTKSKPEKNAAALPSTGHQSSRTLEKLTETTSTRKIDSSTKPGTSGKSDTSQDKCMICRSSKPNCVLLWCGHVVVCLTCGGKLRNCPKPGCGQTIERAAPL